MKLALTLVISLALTLGPTLGPTHAHSLALTQALTITLKLNFVSKKTVNFFFQFQFMNTNGIDNRENRSTERKR